MMRVRFDTGLVLQYNDATWATRSQWGYTDIYTKKDGQWIAQVPHERCVVEVVPPCRVYRDGADVASARIEALVRRNVRLQRMNRELRKKGKAKR